MKMILDAPAVRALVERDPEGTLEMAKTAAQQVATEITHRVVKTRFEASINAMMDNLIRQPTWTPALQPATRKLLDDHLRKTCAEFVESVTRDPINQSIRTEVATHVRAVIENELRAAQKKIDEMIEARAVERIDALLSNRLLKALTQ